MTFSTKWRKKTLFRTKHTAVAISSRRVGRIAHLHLICMHAETKTLPFLPTSFPFLPTSVFLFPWVCVRPEPVLTNRRFQRKKNWRTIGPVSPDAPCRNSAVPPYVVSSISRAAPI